MLQINSIKITNYVIYDKAVLHLDPGVTTIRAKNLDRRRSSASNGAGKSLIPGIIPDIFYDSAPLPMKVKKNARESFKKDTENVLSITDKFNNKFDIKKYFKGSVKFDLIKNGKSLKFRKSVDAKARITKLMPLNEDQFYSLVYLDTKRSPVFQYGTDAQRHHFIESLYKLNVYDKLSERVKKTWDKNRESIQELELLDKQLSQKIDENPGDPTELKERQKLLLNKVTRLRDKVTSLLQKLQECRTYYTLTEDVDLTVSIDELGQNITIKKEEFNKVKKQLREAEQQNQQYEAYVSVINKKLQLEKILEELKDIKIDKTIQEKVRSDRALLNEITEIEKNNQSKRQEINKLSKEIFSISEKQKKQAVELGSTKLKNNLIKDRAKLKEFEVSLEDTKNHLSGNHKNCPVCDSLLNKKIIQKLLEEKETAITNYNSRVAKIKLMIEYANNIEKIQILESQIKPVESQDKVLNRLEKNEDLLNKMRKKVIAKAKFKSLPKVEQASKVPVKNLLNKYESLEKELVDLNKQLDKRVNLDKLELPFSSRKDAILKLKQYEEQLEEYQPLLEKFQSKSHILGSLLSKSEVLIDDINRLSKSVEELKIKTKDHKVLAALRKAFGAKGLRRQRVAQIGEAIEESLNKYAKMLFDFPIRFELVITDTKFQILAHRNKQVSDVRKLSGAESRYFSLLTLVALLPFCPMSQRLDVVILDEIEANLDEVFRRRYVDIFLPELLKIVPKVVIVTPLSEKAFFIPKCHNYMVVKKNDKSILEKI